jgi:hypothetical protein
MLQNFTFEGGPHDGHQIDDSSTHPDTLFVIPFDDGSAYARAGRRVEDASGAAREVFQFDADGSLTERARSEFTDLG